MKLSLVKQSQNTKRINSTSNITSFNGLHTSKNKEIQKYPMCFSNSLNFNT